MKNQLYALQITRRHLALVTLINGGLTPHPTMTKGKHWLLFEIEEDGKDSVNHQIVPERQMMQTHDIAGNCPIFLKLKKY